MYLASLPICLSSRAKILAVLEDFSRLSCSFLAYELLFSHSIFSSSISPFSSFSVSILDFSEDEGRMMVVPGFLFRSSWPIGLFSDLLKGFSLAHRLHINDGSSDGSGSCRRGFEMTMYSGGGEFSRR